MINIFPVSDTVYLAYFNYITYKNQQIIFNKLSEVLPEVTY